MIPEVKGDPFLTVQRLRYEAFSVFASELNKCLNYTDVFEAMASQIKFIIDAFVFRVFFRYQFSEIVCEIYQGEYRFSDQGQSVYPFERKLLEAGLPATYEDAELDGNLLFFGTTFANKKIVLISALPISYAQDHQILVTVASKNKEHSLSIDFRFLKLISELISNKLFQLKLMENIASINEDLKQKNNQIINLNKNLSKIVHERTRELNEANKELTTFFYRTSHDFRAPLANIMGLANIASLVTADQEALHLFNQCSQVARGMAGMLTKLSILTDSFEQSWQPVNFKDFFAVLEQKHRDRLEAGHGRLTCEIAYPTDYFSNIEILNIVLDCLIDNSITYCEQAPCIKIKVFSRNGSLVIKVSDNGPGVDKKIRSKIFDMYYRGNARSEGQGLGLYIARKILKPIAGQISLSVAAKQTSFIIKLPL